MLKRDRSSFVMKRRPFSAITLLAVIMAVVVLLGSCGKDKTETQLAADALKKGLAAHAAGKLDVALKDYRLVLKREPGNVFALYNIGLVAQTSGDNTTAENAYRLAIVHDPNFVRALFNLAIILVARNDLSQAIAVYRKVVTLAPKEANAHLNLGLALKRVKKTAEGNAEIAKAIQLDPSLAKRVSTPAPAASPQ